MRYASSASEKVAALVVHSVGRSLPTPRPRLRARASSLRKERTMSSSALHTTVDPNIACAFCGQTQADGVGLVTTSRRPDVAICYRCLTHLERAMRPEVGTRLSHPPAPSPYSTYPLAGVPVPYYHRLLRVIPLLRAYQHGAFELTVVAL